MTLVNRKDDKPIIWPDSSQIDPISNLLLSKTLQELDSNFYKLCEKYAITQFCLVSIYTTPSLQKKMDCFDTYPNGWIKHYESKQYYLYDPVFSQFGTFHFPFPWSLDSLSKIEQTPIQKTFLSEAYNHNIQKGITFPFSPRLSDQNFLTILDHSKLHPEILPILDRKSVV